MDVLIAQDHEHDGPNDQVGQQEDGHAHGRRQPSAAGRPASSAATASLRRGGRSTARRPPSIFRQRVPLLIVMIEAGGGARGRPAAASRVDLEIGAHFWPPIICPASSCITSNKIKFQFQFPKK